MSVKQTKTIKAKSAKSAKQDLRVTKEGARKPRTRKDGSVSKTQLTKPKTEVFYPQQIAGASLANLDNDFNKSIGSVDSADVAGLQTVVSDPVHRDTTTFKSTHFSDVPPAERTSIDEYVDKVILSEESRIPQSNAPLYTGMGTVGWLTVAIIVIGAGLLLASAYGLL